MPEPRWCAQCEATTVGDVCDFCGGPLGPIPMPTQCFMAIRTGGPYQT